MGFEEILLLFPTGTGRGVKSPVEMSFGSKQNNKSFRPTQPGGRADWVSLSSRVRAELRERFWGDPGRHFPSAVFSY